MLTSTRKKLNITPSEAIVKGISDDGGLFIFENAAEFKFDSSLVDLDYLQLAEKILQFVFDDFEKKDIHDIIAKAYGKENFNNPVEVNDFNDVAFLELWHGPTHAFKDMALTILGRLMVKAKQNIGEKDETLILTATSGDTGSATLSGFKGTGIKAIVLYPNGGVSPVQEAQMHYFAVDGCKAIAVDNNFDYCQTLVKKVFTNKDVVLENKKFSSANSINIGRLVPQIVYYFYSYFQLVKKGKINFGEKINFSVPTGNFGDILAGYIASTMGLPVNKFICASNTNDVLTEFFNTGIYNRLRHFYKTVSPSMDILISSNLERLLYLASDGDSDLICELMTELAENGKYEIPLKIKHNLNCFAAYSLDDEETEKVIANRYKSNDYLIDPHTAVALGALTKYRKATNDKTYCVVVSTANPYKFPNAVASALNLNVSENDIFATIEEIETYTGFMAPQGIKRLKNYEFERTVWSSEEAEVNLRKLSGDKNV